MRLLITGASGLLGLNLALEAMRSETVIGLDRGRLVAPPFELVQADLMAPGVVEDVLARTRPDAAIHCAAMADVDACEQDPDAAWKVNAVLPGKLAASFRNAGVTFLQISTDAVFDGLSSVPYSEEDQPRPSSVYAESKLAGERAVLEVHPGAIVARVNFYGWSATGRRSLSEFFVYNLKSGRPVSGFTDVVFCPMFVSDLARLLLRMIEVRLAGLFHAVGPVPMSKYEFGRRIAGRFGLDEKLISPTSVNDAGLTAKRSPNLNLSVHKLSTVLKRPLPDFSTGLDAFYAQYQQGYPQLLHKYQQVQS